MEPVFEWGEWDNLHGHCADEGHTRYIEAVTLDGVRWAVNDNGDMVSASGDIAENAGRGEFRDEDEVIAIYARDGIECDGEPHRLDAETECVRAIRESQQAAIEGREA